MAKRISSFCTRRQQKHQIRVTRAGDFPIVALGASAGGLEAVSHLLAGLPPKIGMALVLIQHIPSDRVSSLVPLLSRVSKLKVVEATQGAVVEPDYVYVLPPGKDLMYASPVLRLKARDATQRHHLPIDAFMESLALGKRERAIGIVLSGTGSDGTHGLQKIRAEGGITFAQTEESARFDGMPHSAIASGSADFALNPRQIARKLVHLAAHPSLMHSKKRIHGSALEGDALKRILQILRSATGADFTCYRTSTILRRIRRRMVLLKAKNLSDYALTLADLPGEIVALRKDMLIHVTSFFRDTSAFEAIKRKVLSRLLKEKHPEDPIRVWVPGCASGEEVYSLAICLAELARDKSLNFSFQLFGTDISEESLTKARKGSYSASELKHISPKRMRRFFTTENGTRRVVKSIREKCLFAKQDALQDTPFSRLDIISCRNLLIYLVPSAQSRLLSTFHYALKPGGYLILGKAEGIARRTDLYSTVDRARHLFAKKPVASQQASLRRAAAGRRTPGESVESPRAQSHSFLHSQPARPEGVLLARRGPPAVLVSANLEIMQFSGQLSPYLEPTAGDASLNLLKMARSDIVWDVRAAIQKSTKSGHPVRVENVRLDRPGEPASVNLEVIPVPGALASEKAFWIVFESSASAPANGKNKSAADALPTKVQPNAKVSLAARRSAEKHSRVIARLERELSQTRAGLRDIIEAQETANEELQAANEEVLSRNEELQSINEEFETAKEELQSSNEELTTLNEELDHRNSEMVLLNSDLTNLFSSLDIPIVILGRDHRIRRFSPAAEARLNLLPADVGRTVTDLHFGSMYSGLHDEIDAAIKTGKIHARQVRGPDENWFSLRIHPYRTVGDGIQGAILILVDINELHRASGLIEEQREYSDAIIAALRESLLVLDADLRVITANMSFQNAFDLSNSQIVGKYIYEIGGGDWDFPRFRNLLRDVLSKDSEILDLEVDHTFPSIGRRMLVLNAHRFLRRSDGSPLILLAIQDETMHERAQRLSTQLLRVQDEERRRVARELHDGTTQSLGALTANMNRLAKRVPGADPDVRTLLEESRQLAESSLQEIRTVSYLLHPPLLEESGLAAAVRIFAAGFSKRSGIRIDLSIPDEVPRLPKEMELALFRICQECLNNIRHHSGSNSGRIKLAVTSTKAILTITDKGKGLGAEHWTHDAGSIAGDGVGIPSMQERVRQFGGTLDIDSSSKGTMIRAVLPIHQH